MTARGQVWRESPEAPDLGEGEVHVWRASLELPDSDVRRLRDVLTAEERERASRFHFEAHGAHFTAARGLLRAILGRYLNTPPERLRFGYTDRGKPFLKPDGEGLRFNLSHSRGLALYAVARGREVGVDLERIRDGAREQKIAERFFAPGEVAALRAMPGGAQAEAFYNCWTRKEAYIKAVGAGLSFPLQKFEVSLAPGEPAALLRVADDAEAASRWFLQALHPGPGYTGAVAVEGGACEVRCWQW